MQQQSKIQCPQCGYEIDVQNVLAHQLEEEIKKTYHTKLNEERQKFEEQTKKLEEEKAAFEEKKKREIELFQQKLDAQLKVEREQLEKKLKTKVEEEQADQLKELQKELNEKSEQVKELNRSKAEIERLKREKDELKESIEAKAQVALTQKLNEEKEKIRKSEQEKNELKIKEVQKQLEDQKKLVDEMKRKAEQGSMQLQGEVQELALEELLAKTYPFDKVQEVPKGIRGADCIQTVINSMQQECGTIVYESKRTKNFANDWIEKLKQDQINCKADIAVLVTETYPVDMDRFGERNGIWICGFHEIKSLSFVLREMLIKTHSVKISQENKGDKMELLYNYFTSNEFIQNIKRIVENYDAMIDQLNSEKKAMYKIWATREKHIWVVQENISALFGSIKGIAGKELKTSNILELPDKQIED